MRNEINEPKYPKNDCLRFDKSKNIPPPHQSTIHFSAIKR